MHVQDLLDSMNAAGVDALVYPTWSNPAQLAGDYASADGTCCITQQQCAFCFKS